MLRAVKVFVTGSSDLPEEYVGFARELGRRLMTDTGLVLVTGGLSSKIDGRGPALDEVIAYAAFEALGKSSQSAQSRIVTILPETDSASLKRFSLGSVVRVSYAGPRTRRYSMVLTSDAVVAVNGAKSTTEVIDLAYVAGKPLIPIPATGGSALESWNRYELELTQRLRLNQEDILALKDASSGSKAIATCLNILSRVLRPRCFVAMPFSAHPLANAFETIRSIAEEQGYQAIRVDQESFTGNIIEAIWESIRHSDVVIADLTGHNPNVYYEMGISHAFSKPTLLLIFSRDGSIPTNIPFDLRVQRIIPYGTTQSLRAQLNENLPKASSRTKNS